MKMQPKMVPTDTPALAPPERPRGWSAGPEGMDGILSTAPVDQGMRRPNRAKRLSLRVRWIGLRWIVGEAAGGTRAQKRGSAGVCQEVRR